MEPRIQYAQTSDGVSIAFWTLGEGGTPLVITPLLGFSHVVLECQDPAILSWYQGLAQHRMVVRYDPRGQGLSQRELSDEELAKGYEDWDIRALVERLGLERLSLLGVAGCAGIAVVFAAEHPELVERLILVNPSHGPDFENPTVKAVVGLARDDWRLFTETWAHMLAGWSRGSPAQQYATFVRRSVSQDYVIRITEILLAFNLTPYLSRIEAPTLVMNDARGRGGSLETARLVASGIKDARLVLFESDPGQFYESEQAQKAIQEFLGDSADQRAAVELPEGTAVILFLDIADSTALTERLGDAAFRARASELDASLRAAIRDAGGTAVEGKVLGDGVMAVFTSARQAIEAALRCHAVGENVGLPLHIGIHAGDVIREGNNVYGGAVNVAARVAGASAPGEILVSDTVRGLARTSADVRFEDRGEQELKGIAEPQRLFAVRGPG